MERPFSDQRDCEVALIGTGIAPLVAANHLINQGKSVLILNPDLDFFLEDSELPLDPMMPLGAQSFQAASLRLQDSETVLQELRPHFPGAVESWVPGGARVPSGSFHDPFAPHVRQRSRLWIQPEAGRFVRNRDEQGLGQSHVWDLLEEAYVNASDLGLNPKILDGLQAEKRFPGFSGTNAVPGHRGILISKFCDVDVSRYRNGILEFLRERLGAERFILAATQIEFMPGGLRFYSRGKPLTARVSEQVLVFWTPKLSSWIVNQAKKTETVPRSPLGIRLWEEWSFVSRERLDPETIGVFGSSVVWAETEGAPGEEPLHRLSVLRCGQRVGLGNSSAAGWISSESFESLSELLGDFLNWNRFTIRSMKHRAIFEWDSSDPETSRPWTLKSEDPRVKIVPNCDGPLVKVVRTAREASV